VNILKTPSPVILQTSLTPIAHYTVSSGVSASQLEGLVFEPKNNVGDDNLTGQSQK